MKTLFLISESINSLNINEMTQSSQKYELNFAESLSEYMRVVIISFAFKGFYASKGNLELNGIGNERNKFSLLNAGFPRKM